jgi:hypothetical protein
MALFGDWRDVRAAVEAAIETVDGTRPTGNLDKRDYALVEAALEHYRQAQAFACVECGEKVPYGQEIRCVDCKGAMHEGCAKRHFWPNGRPRGDRPR